MSAKASNDQQKAAGAARLQEVTRQGAVMQNQQRMQDQQNADALEARKKFQESSQNAYGPEQLKKDAAEGQSPLAQALAAAGDRGAANLNAPTADATRSTGAVSVQGGADAQTPASSAYQAALAGRMGQASATNSQQANALATMQALSQAQILGNQRLQNSANDIQLSGARLQAINRPLSAQSLLSSASNSLYQTEAEKAMNAGAGARLAGQGMQALGQIGYAAASAGAFKGSGSPGTVNSQELTLKPGEYIGGGL